MPNFDHIETFTSVRLRGWVLLSFCLAFVVILLGAYTRLSDAGLSCPDWPHCFGYLTAPHTDTQLKIAAARFPASPIDIKKAWTEMTHRYFAGTVGILVLFIAGNLILRPRMYGPGKGMGIALVALLGCQVFLGMLTVTAKLKPIIVLAHLLTGFALLSILWWTYLSISTRAQQQNSSLLFKRPLLPWLWLGLLILVTQIALGGWVSSHSAGLACISFPSCNGIWLPPMHIQAFNTDLITIHMMHRLGALLTAFYLVILAIKLLRQRELILAMSLFILLTSQITLGILNVLWFRPTWIALLHHALAAGLLLTLLYAIAKITFCSELRYAYRR